MMSHDDTSALVHEIDQIDALLEAFTAEIEQSTVYWHSITEIPPIDAERTAKHHFDISAPLLLVGYDQDDGDREYHCGYYSHQIAEWEWDDKYADDPFTPTHWCDLPTLPEVMQ